VVVQLGLVSVMQTGVALKLCVFKVLSSKSFSCACVCVYIACLIVPLFEYFKRDDVTGSDKISLIVFPIA